MEKFADNRLSQQTDALLALLVKAKAAAEAGQTEEAAALLDNMVIEKVNEVIEADSCRTDVTLLIANAFHAMGQLTVAEHYYRKVLDHEPNPLAYINMGHICNFSGRLAEAIGFREQALELSPTDASLYCDLGCSLIFAGRKAEGIELLQEAVELAPGDAGIHSALLFRLHHMPHLDRQKLLEEHKRWAAIHASAVRVKACHENDTCPDRRLRIGYISPDFRTHPVASFFESLLAGHNRDLFEVYGYGNVARPDDVTKRFELTFDHYRSIYSLQGRDVLELIERDRIDILVDLAGHTPGNSLAAMAHKPAPIAVTYLGYPDTTGMKQIDYRLTDSLADPPASQDFYTERLVCLSDGFLCYRPPDCSPAVGPLPVLRNGWITFGSFNDGSKLNSDIIALWAQVLKTNDRSRFLLKSRAGDDPGMREVYHRWFEQCGISRDRVEIHGQKTAAEYLKLYGSVDIALDTYPYNGTTTTCDAIWMGVPVVTLVGEHHASRVGLSILTRVGLEFLAASTEAEFVAQATALAHNPEALVDTRFSMRRRMEAAALCNVKAFAQSVETAYRKMWLRWCRSQGVDVLNEDIDMAPAVCACEPAQMSSEVERQK